MVKCWVNGLHTLCTTTYVPFFYVCGELGPLLISSFYYINRKFFENYIMMTSKVDFIFHIHKKTEDML